MVVLGPAPEAGAVEAWETGYFDAAVAMNIDVRFVVREMGRLFFLSEEYDQRNRSDAELGALVCTQRDSANTDHYKLQHGVAAFPSVGDPVP